MFKEQESLREQELCFGKTQGSDSYHSVLEVKVMIVAASMSSRYTSCQLHSASTLTGIIVNICLLLFQENITEVN